MSCNILTHKTIYKPTDINYIIGLIKNTEIKTTQKDCEYYNIPCSFDIETSSFYDKFQNSEKRAIMYEWTLCLDGYVIIGREKNEFIDVINKIVLGLELWEKRRLIIYIHNESYEFQFIRKLFIWHTVFALDKRKPVKCMTLDGIEFRCSYLLSGYKLETLAKNLKKYKIEKLVGNLDYKKIRTPTTPLTDKEISYCVNDCLVVVAYIQELIEQYGDITKLPLTKTGFVRNSCRNECLYDSKSHKKSTKYSKYRKLMRNLTLDTFTYIQLKKAFAGGFTHASLFHSGKIVKNVSSFDFTSSYPYVICSEKFPMSSPIYGIPKNSEELRNWLINYCCVFTIEFRNLEERIYYENYISKSKCEILESYEENNGRIKNAKRLQITITEQDYLIIRKFYTWKSMRITNFIRFTKGYLPKDFIHNVLIQYENKTKLKGVDGKEEEYMNAKEFVNSLYGMMVTDICRDEIIYQDDEWNSEKPDYDEMITKYNNSVKRFLYYAWGIYVTAYARRNLFTGILEFGEDYIYSDTDSIKVINVDNHREYIEDYNRQVKEKLKLAMEYHGLDFNLTCPKTVKGEEKQLGVWEEETKKGVYTRFKTLGAKRYLVEQNGELHLTVAGLGKTAINYMKEKFKDRVFENFDEDMYIPKGYAGKMTHTYIDEETSGVVEDYLGNIYEYNELSSTHLEDADYSLSLAEHYAKLLLGFNS